jgi:nicotinate-nucleotide--dimethylbenzimidazole phosphoribosyltransferase
MHISLPEIPALNSLARAKAEARQSSLTKPPGSLGRLEEVACAIAAMQGEAVPAFSRRAIVVAAADHGVTAEGVSAYPSEVTAQMVLNFLSGGAAINALARQAGAEVIVADAGVAHDLPASGSLVRAALTKGTANMAHGPAMPLEHAARIVERGAELGASLGERGRALVGFGEMGIGNTTAASAITAVMTGMSASDVTGRGTGIDDERLRHKVSVVERAIAVNKPNHADALDVLAKVGGYEIGYLAGVMIGVASVRGTLTLDGYISTSAALIAAGIAPATRDYMIAGHRSVEPGHRHALALLGLDPLLDLGMRLGEGTGAALAMQVIESALAAHREMATFGEAGVSGATE